MISMCPKRSGLSREATFNSLLPCLRQDPFGILYFSPFPRRAAVEPRKQGAGVGEEETCWGRVSAPADNSEAKDRLHPPCSRF